MDRKMSRRREVYLRKRLITGVALSKRCRTVTDNDDSNVIPRPPAEKMIDSKSLLYSRAKQVR